MRIEERQEKLEELITKYGIEVDNPDEVIKNTQFEEVVIPFYNWIIKSKLINSNINKMKKKIRVYYDTIVITISGRVPELKIPNNLKNIKIGVETAGTIIIYSIKSIYNIDHLLQNTIYKLESHKDFLVMEKLELNYLNKALGYLNYHKEVKGCTRRYIEDLWERMLDLAEILENHIDYLGKPSYKDEITLAKIAELKSEIDDNIKAAQDIKMLQKDMTRLQILVKNAIEFLETKQQN